MKSRFLFISIAFLLGSFILFSFTLVQQQKGKEWPTPDKYAKMKNTVKADDKSIAAGKALWNKYCKSCHGSKGLGDGTKAAGLKTFPGNFASKEFKALPDGAIYYRSFIGRGEMPNYEKSIPDEEDRWHLVNFMKSLAK